MSTDNHDAQDNGSQEPTPFDEIDRKDEIAPEVEEISFQPESVNETELPSIDTGETQALGETFLPSIDSGEAPMPHETEFPIFDTGEPQTPQVTELPVFDTGETPMRHETELPIFDTGEPQTPQVTELPVFDTGETQVQHETELPVFDTGEAQDESALPPGDLVEPLLPEVSTPEETPKGKKKKKEKPVKAPKTKPEKQKPARAPKEKSPIVLLKERKQALEAEKKELLKRKKALEGSRKKVEIKTEDPAQKQAVLDETDREIGACDQEIQAKDREIETVTQEIVLLKPPKGRSKLLPIIGAVLLLLLLGVGGYFGFTFLKSQGEGKRVEAFADAVNAAKIDDPSTLKTADELYQAVQGIPNLNAKHPKAVEAKNTLDKKRQQATALQGIQTALQGLKDEFAQPREALTALETEATELGEPDIDNRRELEEIENRREKIIAEIATLEDRLNDEQFRSTDADVARVLDKHVPLIREEGDRLRQRGEELKATVSEKLATIKILEDEKVAEDAEKQRQEDFAKFLAAAETSVETATGNPDRYDPSELKQTDLDKAGETATLAEEQRKVSDMETQFQRIRNKAVEQSFFLALKHAEDSAAAVYDPEDPDNSVASESLDERSWDKLDHDSLKRAKDLMNEHIELLERHKPELDRIEQRFKEIQNHVADNAFAKLDAEAADLLVKAREKRDETLLDDTVLEKMETMIKEGRVVSKKKALLDKARTDSETLKAELVKERSEALAAYAAEEEKRFQNGILDNSDLTLAEKYHRLQALKGDLQQRIEQVGKDAGEGRQTTPDSLAEATELQDRVSDKIHVLIPEAVTAVVGDPDAFVALLEHICTEIPDLPMYGPGFRHVLDLESREHYFPKLERWNAFVENYGEEIDVSRPSQHSIRPILRFVENDLPDMGFIPEHEVLKDYRKYLRDSFKAWGLYRSYFAETLTMLDRDSGSTYVKRFRDELARLQDTDRPRRAEFWHAEMIRLLEKVVKDDTADPLTRLGIVKIVTTVLAQDDPFFLHVTQRWRSRYTASVFSRNPGIFRDPAASAAVVAQAETLLADYPLAVMRGTVARSSQSILRLPAKPDTPGDLGTAYRWVGWVDREDDASPLLVRVSEKCLDGQTGPGTLYAILTYDDQSAFAEMRAVGISHDDKAELAEGKDDLPLGTPVFFRPSDHESLQAIGSQP